MGSDSTSAPLAKAALHGPFVGRDDPLRALVSTIDAAAHGHGVVALVAGEPGIGKTRLVAEAVARSHCRVLWATCWNSDGAPAFWPWWQLVRAARSGAEPDGTAHDLVPELTTVLGDPRWVDEAGADARFRLFDAVTGALAAVADERPLVLVIDDLQWADAGSIRMLQFLGRDPRARYMTIIGTYRDGASATDGPLAEALSELTVHGLHLRLEGVDEHAVEALARALVHEGTAVPEARLLQRRCGGNPFFVRELARLLDTAGRRGDDTGRVPSSVRAVVAMRLGALSMPAREALSAAAVIGAEFDPSVVAAVIDRASADVLHALDEATAAGIVDWSADRLRFAFNHALVQEVLYAELRIVERARLHARVADVLAERFGHARATEVAHHLVRATVGESDDRAVDWAVRAAEHNFATLAYEHAALWYGRALELLPAGSSDREGELLIRRGAAATAAGDIPTARDAFRQAAVVARQRGDNVQLAHAALGLGAGHGGFEVPLHDSVQIALLEEALAALGPAASALRSRLLARLSVALSMSEREDHRRQLSEQAIATAREVADQSALGYALAVHCDVISGPDWSEQRRDEAAEVIGLAQRLGDRELELLGHRLRLVAHLELGDIASADDAVARFERVAEVLGQPLYRWYVPLWHAMRALMRADLAEATRLNAVADEAGRLAHSHNAAVLTLTQRWVCQRAAGNFAESGEAMARDLGLEPGGMPNVTGEYLVRLRAVIATQLGQLEQASALIRQWLESGLHERPHDSEWLPDSAQAAEVAALVGARDVAAVLLEQLTPYAHRFCVEGIAAALTGSVSWYLAMLARSLGRNVDAATFEADARDAHRRVGLVGDPAPLAASGAPRTTAPRPAGPASMIHEGATWAVTYAGRTVRLRDSKGLRDLAVLLERPDDEFHCLELVGGADVGSDTGPALDAQARRAYEQRISELHDEIDDARRASDPFRAERAEAELDALVQQLASAFGLSGRSRTSGAASERARSTVTARIRSAIRNASEVHPELGRHLQNAVSTGTWCAYRPEAPVAWDITT